MASPAKPVPLIVIAIPQIYPATMTNSNRQMRTTSTMQTELNNELELAPAFPLKITGHYIGVVVTSIVIASAYNQIV